MPRSEPEKRLFQVVVSSPARRDLAVIARWSASEFGKAAAIRYRALIFQSLRDLASDPERPGSKAYPEVMVDTARTYPLSFSRFRVQGTRVNKPRHFLLYRLKTPGTIEIARILHDSSDLRKHLPKSYKRM